MCSSLELQAGISVDHSRESLSLLNKAEQAASMKAVHQPHNEVKQVLSRANVMGRRESRRTTMLKIILWEQLNPQVTTTRISN